MNLSRSLPTGIAVAPNGARKSKADHPALPMTRQELAQTAAACAEAGAALLHLHVRDAAGRHLLDAEAYKQAMAAIHAEVGTRMIVQITTEAVGRYSPSEQIELIKKVRPEAASIALRELVPTPEHEAEFAKLSTWMAAENILPQIILYSEDDVRALADLLKRGALAWPEPPVLFVLGRYAAGQQSVPSDLLEFFAPDLPRPAHWSVCAFGQREAACVVSGALLGGHVRVGFENNLFLPDGALALDNAALIRAVTEPLSQLGRRIAGADEMRAAMGGGR